jgi:beta-galactosidase
VLSELAGVTVEEFGKQNAPDERPLWVYLPTGESQARTWYEALQAQGGGEPGGSQPLATWRGRHLEGQTAATIRRVGQGAVIYMGAYLSADLLEGLLPEIERVKPLARLWPFAPAGVQVSCRKSETKEVWFFINVSDAPQTIAQLPAGGVDLITGEPAPSSLELEPNGVAVIETARSATPGV